MDCQSSPADPMYPSFASRRSCTTQSESVKPAPGLADENPIMAMSPEQMPQSRYSVMEHCSARLPPSPSYTSHQQISSYPSSEPLACIEPHLPSQQLVVRPHTWDAPQTSTWGTEAPGHAFSGAAAARRDLPWNSFSHGCVQPWMPAEQYEQVTFGGQTGYPQPLYPATTEQLHSYSQGPSSITTEDAPYYGYPSMSPRVSQTASFSLGGPSSASGSTFQGPSPYPGTSFDTPPSPFTVDQTTAAAPTASLDSSPRVAHHQDGRMQSPAPSAAYFCDEPAAGRYAEAEDASTSLSPPGQQDTRPSSDPAEANGTTETPYAQLIYQALLSRPRHAMRLQEIYQWFLENTNKGQDGTKGWQNSIRHNLSMNGAFERRPIKGNANDSGDECSSPSGAHKQAAEWVLLDSAVENGLQSTTRYRNHTRRGQTNRGRGRNTRSRRASRRPPRAQVAARPAILGYSLPAIPRSFHRHDYRFHSNHGQLGPQYDSLAEQLERSSLDEQRRAMYFAGGIEYYPGTQSSYASPPLIYSPELFMPSAQGAPTVVSDSDDNEAMTPETSFAGLEPTVLLPGDNNSGTPGPTSDPYSRGPSAYYNSSNTSDPHGGPRYTMGDVAGVVDDNTLQRCCGWNGHTTSRQ